MADPNRPPETSGSAEPAPPAPTAEADKRHTLAYFFASDEPAREEPTAPPAHRPARTRLGLPSVTITPDGQVRLSAALADSEAPETSGLRSFLDGSKGAAGAEAPRPSSPSQTMLQIPTVPLPSQPPRRSGGTARIELVSHPAPKQPDWRLAFRPEPRMPRAASYRSLRHRVADRGDPHTLLVTSAARGEGRTTCAANLALALAELRRFQVLLVEADLGRASLAALFGISSPTCFHRQAVERHAGDVVRPWSVHTVGSFELHLAPLDPRASRPAAWEPAVIAGALDQLRKSYDYVVVDAPPVTPTADVHVMQEAVDGVILVARAGLTRSRHVQAAADQIAQGKNLGVVLLDE